MHLLKVVELFLRVLVTVRILMRFCMYIELIHDVH